MKPRAQSVEEQEQGQGLTLPRLGHQHSLRDLIEEDLQSRDDVSIEMAGLLRRAKSADSDSATIAAQDEGTEVKRRILPTQIDDNERSQNPKVAGSPSGAEPINGRFWKRIIKRYRRLMRTKLGQYPRYGSLYSARMQTKSHNRTAEGHIQPQTTQDTQTNSYVSPYPSLC